MLRRFAETLARNKTVKRTLPNGTKIYLSPDSQLKYLKSKFDLDLIELAEAYSSPDAVIWDIGANCGVLSFSLSNAKQVIAVEADPFLVTVLQESVRISQLPVTIIPAAVYSRTGMAEFAISKRGRASNHLVAVGGNGQTGGERSRIMVPTITLDQMLIEFGPPTFIKIDVEGAEIDVFKGADRVLNVAKPTIYFECTEKTLQECQKILVESGYYITKGAEMNWIAKPNPL